jgi:hypothetical protein
MSERITIGEFLGGILPRLLSDKKFPQWPPDCFALCISLFRRTGAYSTLFQDWPPGDKVEDALDQWAERIRELAKEWRAAWSQNRLFDQLETEWQLLAGSFSELVDSLSKNHDLCVAIMKLIAVADEASEGVGTPIADTTDEDDRFLAEISSFLTRDNTLCDEIDSSRLRVLPRMHTPQNGLTERSLSFYLSLCDPVEVVPRWLPTPFIQEDSLNLLMVPWPFEVIVSEFMIEQLRRPTTCQRSSAFSLTKRLWTRMLPPSWNLSSRKRAASWAGLTGSYFQSRRLRKCNSALFVTGCLKNAS